MALWKVESYDKVNDTSIYFQAYNFAMKIL